MGSAWKKYSGKGRCERSLKWKTDPSNELTPLEEDIWRSGQCAIRRRCCSWKLKDEVRRGALPVSLTSFSAS
jgi:hypothetical protein